VGGLDAPAGRGSLFCADSGAIFEEEWVYSEGGSSVGSAEVGDVEEPDLVEQAQQRWGNSNGMSPRMMSSGANSGAGLPESFADYMPVAQVGLVYGVGPSAGHRGAGGAVRAGAVCARVE